MIDYCHLKKRKNHYLEGDETKIENYAEKTVFRRECPGEGWVLGLSPSSKAGYQRRKRE